MKGLGELLVAHHLQSMTFIGIGLLRSTLGALPLCYHCSILGQINLHLVLAPRKPQLSGYGLLPLAGVEVSRQNAVCKIAIVRLGRKSSARRVSARGKI